MPREGLYGRPSGLQNQNVNDLIKAYYKRSVRSPTNEERRKASRYVMERVNPILDYVRDKEFGFGKGTIYIGSSYSGAKVGQADEFDLNIPLNITRQERKSMSFERSSDRFYGFNDTSRCSVRLKTIPNDLDIVSCHVAQSLPPKGYGYLHCPEWEADDESILLDGDIVSFNVRRKLKRLIEEGRNNLPDILRKTVRIERIIHGPAITLDIFDEKSDTTFATVDFSPVVPRIHGNHFPKDCGWPRPGAKWPPSDMKKLIKRNFSPNVVAKTPFYWVYSYAEAEKALLRRCDIGRDTCRLMAHRIMKKLNMDFWLLDKPNHKPLSSYILKTIFLWECEKYPYDRQWKQNCLWKRLRSMTQHLVEILERPPKERTLLQYFDKRLDILDGYDIKKHKILDLCLLKIKVFLDSPASILKFQEV